MPFNWGNERDRSSVCGEDWRFLEAHRRSEFVQLDDSRGVFLISSQLPEAHEERGCDEAAGDEPQPATRARRPYPRYR